MTHTVDLVRYFLGDAVEVFAHGTTEFNKKPAAIASNYAIEDRAFLDAVRSGDHSNILSDYADGFKTSLVTVGANQSLQTGQPVSID